MEVYLIRHAHAGSRSAGSRDRYRPLSDDGHAQAESLVAFFEPRSIGAVYASPATRCVQTVEPLALQAGLAVIEDDNLWEDVGLDEMFEVLDRATATADPNQSSAVICSHGNLIPALVERLAHEGADVHGRGCERASIWMIRHDGDRWAEARYFTPRSGYTN